MSTKDYLIKAEEAGELVFNEQTQSYESLEKYVEGWYLQLDQDPKAIKQMEAKLDDRQS